MIVKTLIWKQFTQRKLRSFLTIIGIVIGVSALVSLVILANALEESIVGQFDAFSPNTLLLAPLASLGGNGGPQGFGVFTNNDVEFLRSIPQIEFVGAMINTNQIITYGQDTIRNQIMGAELDIPDSTVTFKDFLDADLLDGRFIEAADKNNNVVNIGYRTAKDAFDKEIFVGNAIKINNTKFIVVGIFDYEGKSNVDNAIYMPIDAARKMLGSPDAVSAIRIEISQGADMEILRERIVNRLKKYRGEEDFATITPTEIQAEISSFLGVINLVVLSVAIISLFVGALGIMNSLYTSVLQRTKEIGTMKAVGATNKTILAIFVSESAILGFFGGIGGMIVGSGLAALFIYAINLAGIFKLEFSFDVALTLFGVSINIYLFTLIFSVLLGIISGLFPALRAAKLRPVDALRYE